MLFSKRVWYDWFGLNELLFKHINAYHTEFTDAAARFFNDAGDYRHFPYIFVGIVGLAAVDYLIRKIRKRGGNAQRLHAWIGVFAVLGVCFVVNSYSVRTMKEYMEYPRPFEVYGVENIHIIQEPGKTVQPNSSFPSGHAAFITFLALSLTPVLSLGWAWMVRLLVVGVCWARMASGMHFPADVLGGILIAMLVIGLIRPLIYWFMRNIFGFRCYMYQNF